MGVIPADIIKPWATKAQREEGEGEESVFKKLHPQKKILLSMWKGGERGLEPW